MGKVVRFKKRKTRKSKKARIRPEGAARGEVWQAALARMPAWVQEDDGDEKYRPWAGVALSLTQDFLGGCDLVHPDERGPEQVVDALRSLAELCGRWPDVLELRDAALVEILERLPELSSTTLVHRPRLGGIEAVLDKFNRDLNKEASALPSADSVPGVTVAELRAFARAALAFYDAEPWRELVADDLIRIESRVPDPSLRHMSITGRGGNEIGAVFLELAEDFMEISSGTDEDEILRERPMWSLTFWEPHELDFREHDLWEDEDLPVTDGGLIPTAVCFGPKRRLRRASPKILAFLEGLLLALAESTGEDLDALAWEREVHTSAGAVKLAFSLVDWDEIDDADDEFAAFPSHTMMERRLRQMSIRATEAGGDEAEVSNQLSLFDDGQDGGMGPSSPRERAQDLAFKAMDATGRRRRVFARQALDIWPDCADALCVLAGDVVEIEDAVELYRQALAAAARDLGEAYFSEHVGHFWGIVETRPYMRAKLTLAQSLMDLGRRAEALQHYRELLRLNPDDNQGVRQLLVPELIVDGALDEAKELLEEYKDLYSAEWHYSWALLSLLQLGDNRTSRRRLTEAFKCNPHFAAVLLGLLDMPDKPPHFFKPGDISEAYVAASYIGHAWSSTPEAMSWLGDRWDHFTNS